MPPRKPLTHPEDGWPCLLYSAWLELVNSRATLQTELIIVQTNIEERGVIHSSASVSQSQTNHFILIDISGGEFVLFQISLSGWVR